MASGAKKGTKDARATNMLELVKGMGAPEEIERAAYDAMHHYMTACDLRRAGYNNRESGVRLRNKAKREAYQGDKKFNIALAWFESNKAAFRDKLDARLNALSVGI